MGVPGSELKTIVLTRKETSSEGTFGELVVDNFVYLTGEAPWLDNQENLSCIPVGTYRCMRTYSPRFERDTYQLKDVWRRTDVRIHPANFMGDRRRGLYQEVQGCIALGKLIGPMNGQKALLKSKYAVASFEAYMGNIDFLLEIRGAQRLA